MDLVLLMPSGQMGFWAPPDVGNGNGEGENLFPYLTVVSGPATITKPGKYRLKLVVRYTDPKSSGVPLQ